MKDGIVLICYFERERVDIWTKIKIAQKVVLLVALRERVSNVICRRNRRIGRMSKLTVQLGAVQQWSMCKEHCEIGIIFWLLRSWESSRFSNAKVKSNAGTHIIQSIKTSNGFSFISH